MNAGPPKFNRSNYQYNWLYVTLALTFILFSFITRVSLLYYESSGFIHGVLHIPNGWPWTGFELRLRRLEDRTPPRRLGFGLVQSFYMLAICANNLYRSQAWEVGYLVFGRILTDCYFRLRGCFLLSFGAQFVFGYLGLGEIICYFTSLRMC